MKKSYLTAGISFFIAVLISMPLHAETLKIAVFDLQKIMGESKTVNSYRQKLEKEVEAKRKTLLEKQETVKQIEERLKKDGQGITPSERKELEEKRANEIKELRRMKEDIDSEIQKMDKELTQRVLKDIDDKVKEIAKKENYTIIFEKNAGGIAHFGESVDITEKVIKAYDKK